MNDEHAKALMQEMAKLPDNPTSEIAIGLAKAQSALANSQMESAGKANALGAAMSEARDKLRRSLQGTQVCCAYCQLSQQAELSVTGIEKYSCQLPRRY